MDNIYGHCACTIVDKEVFQKLLRNSKVKHSYIGFMDADKKTRRTILMALGALEIDIVMQVNVA